MLVPVGGGALALGNGAGEGEARAALYLGHGDGIFTEITWAWLVLVNESDGPSLLGGIDDLEEGIGDGDVLLVLANHLGVLAHNGACKDHEPLVAFGPAVHFLLEYAPMVVVEFGVLRAHVGHVEALLHCGSIPTHIHRGCHVATAIATATVFPILGAGLDAAVLGIVVVLARLVVGGVGHRDHRRREFIGDAVGDVQRGVKVDSDGLVIQHLVGDALGDTDRQQGVGALLGDGCSRSGLADGGDGYQTGRAGLAGRTGFTGFAGRAGRTGLAGFGGFGGGLLFGFFILLFALGLG